MRNPGPSRTRAALVVTASAALLLTTASVAGAVVDDTKLKPRTHFVMQPDGSTGLTAKGAKIPNIDSVKSTIRTYYGATSAGIANKETSPYITEMEAIEAKVLEQLPTVDPSSNKAVVLDADDTTLWTYDMEDGEMKFNFDPARQNVWVQEKKFPATPGMVDFVDAVAAKGYHVFGITGRSASQEDATVGNLKDVGYTQFTNDNFFTKFDSTHPKPDWLSCNTSVDPADDPAKCTTVEYKAGTRKYIEQTLGQDIVLNIGDQFSDLAGGYADVAVKLPNPTYYLPSPNIKGAPQSDGDLKPRVRFTMAPDGSSGTTEGGEGIPNIDSVKSTIRTYYGADASGIANKITSPYISEMKRFADRWAPSLRGKCASARARAHGVRPAVVFDADDTTLWTYDMEDGEMKFNFNPALQDVWVQGKKFPATPKMPRVVRAAARGGCVVVGITGRNNAQRDATLANLAEFYRDKDGQNLFRPKYYFTKWTSSEQPPSYVDCTLDGDATKCSTIEYKSSTRKYVEEHFKLDIIANFGDQYSDLIGGYSNRVAKLPNPTYYLP